MALFPMVYPHRRVRFLHDGVSSHGRPPFGSFTNTIPTIRRCFSMEWYVVIKFMQYAPFAQRFLDRPHYAIRPGRSRGGAAAG